MNTRASWNDRHAARPDRAPPASFIADRDHLLPPGGHALDVAGGAGRHAIWLAGRGFSVTLVDISDVAIAQAQSAAAQAGVAITCVQADLATEPVPTGAFEVIVVHHYLDRDVWAALPDKLAPGGVLFTCQPTVVNLERHPRPSARWLLDAGELAIMAEAILDADPDLEMVELTESWSAEGRHEARLVLRRAW